VKITVLNSAGEQRERLVETTTFCPNRAREPDAVIGIGT
jgi:hypothetical protein